MKPTFAAAAALLTLTACERIVTGADGKSGPLQLESASLPDGQVDAPYAVALSASGGVPPYEFSIAAGALPGGLTLAADGSISGTPLSPGASVFTATVGDSATPAQTSSRSLSILIAPAPLQIQSNSLPDGQMDTPYLAALAASGGVPPYEFSIAAGELPGGLALAADGTISGTPSAAGYYAFTAMVADGWAPAQTASQILSILIAPAPGLLAIATEALPRGVRGMPYDFALVAVNGTPPYTWSVSAGSPPEGIALSADGVLSGTPTKPGTSTFVATVTDGAAPPQTASKRLSLTVQQ